VDEEQEQDYEQSNNEQHNVTNKKKTRLEKKNKKVNLFFKNRA